MQPFIHENNVSTFKLDSSGYFSQNETAVIRRLIIMFVFGERYIHPKLQTRECGDHHRRETTCKREDTVCTSNAIVVLSANQNLPSCPGDLSSFRYLLNLNLQA
jgi:hypothetical protein